MRRTRERTKNIPRLVLSFFYCLLLYFSVVVNERIAWIELCILFQSYSALVSLSSTLRFVSVLPVHRLLRGPLHHLRTRPNPGGVRRRRNRKHHPLPGWLFFKSHFLGKSSSVLSTERDGACFQLPIFQNFNLKEDCRSYQETLFEKKSFESNEFLGDARIDWWGQTKLG